MTKTVSIQNAEVFTRLWVHECSRVFYDRLINDEDRDFFKELIIDLVGTKFKAKW
jgi:dynein heavy chain